MTKDELETLMAKAKASVISLSEIVKQLDSEALADEIEEIQNDVQEFVEEIEETLDGYSE